MEFDLCRFQAALPSIQISIPDFQQPTPPNYRIHLFDCIPSTNQVLWERIGNQPDEGSVAIALQQSCGRGQWGRQWQSPRGGLYLSLTLHPNLPAPQGAQLTLSIAWGIAKALRQYDIPVLLKWLNDLVIDGRKLAGILTETRIRQGCITQAVVGIGINWTNPVPETGINLAEVLTKQASPTIDSLEMLAAIALQGAMTGYTYGQTCGIDAVLAQYQALWANLGQFITVNDLPGQIVGITSTGSLRVRPQRLDDQLKDKRCKNIYCEDIYLEAGSISLGYFSGT